MTQPFSLSFPTVDAAIPRGDVGLGFTAYRPFSILEAQYFSFKHLLAK